METGSARVFRTGVRFPTPPPLSPHGLPCHDGVVTDAPPPFESDETPTRPDLRCRSCNGRGKIILDVEARPSEITCAWCAGEGVLTEEGLKVWEAVERAKKSP
jgi:hypothetical protein